MAKILVVEDDRDLGTMIVDWLRFEHHSVELVHDGSQGMNRLQCSEYDIVILDWNLPGMDGIDICRQYRAEGGMSPVVMLTGKSAVNEKEVGLDAGADDYLTKPFNMKELSARLRALLRRPAGLIGNVLKARDIELDPQRFLVMKSGVEVQLLPKEFSLLEFFMRHPGQVFSAEALIQRVWASDTDATGDAIRTCLKRLRKKLEDSDDKDPIIQTIHGVGYRLRA